MIFFCVGFAIVLLIVWVTVGRKPKHNSRSIPIPDGYPIIGNPRLQANLMFTKSTLLKISNTIKKYSTPFILAFGSFRTVFIDKPKDIQKLLFCPKSEIYQLIPFNNGLVSQNDLSVWKSYRNFLLPSFTSSAVKSMVPLFNKHARALQQIMNGKINANEFNILKIIGACIVRQNAKILLRAELLPGEDEFLFVEIKKQSKRTSQHVIIYIILKSIAAKFTSIVKFTGPSEKILIPVITRAMASIKRLFIHDPHKKESNVLFLDRVMQMTNNPVIKGVNEIDHIAQVFGAAVDTTASTISNIILLLAMHPEIQEKCFAEIQGLNLCVIDEFDFALLTSQIPYLSMTIKESMRIIPSVPLISKHAEQDIQLDDYDLPAGSDVVVVLFTLFRNKEIWGEDADEFNPDHFLPELEAKRHKYAFLPFSFGPRICIGAQYAMINMKIVMMHLIKNFKFSTSLKLKDLTFKALLSTSIAEGHMIRLERRT